MSLGRRLSLFTAAALAIGLAVPPGSAAASPEPRTRPAAPPACDPTGTAPHYRGTVPTPRQVLGFDLGEREVTTAESDRYLAAVTAASDRAVAGTLATSWQGRPLRYAIVGRAENVTPGGLARIRHAAAKLRDPRTSAAEARRLVRGTPAILWVTGNVHGNEESGTDAALRTLRDLADRDDCAARRILDNALVVVLPVQNPDGREADSRRNFYGFDMNRDWFARTQPETDGKLAVLNQYPPVLFIDAHEMGGTSYFFPPNADPMYHEITGESIDWINNLYGSAMAAEFTRRGIDFFNRDVYDLFYMGYGDTVPSTGFIAAGMTFEKGGESPISERTLEQYLTQWVSLSAAAANREQILTRWHAAHVQARRQGEQGVLEPNEIINPGNDLQTQVPDRPVRHYFLRADDPSRTAEVRTVVRRLQRMGVEVRRLVLPLTVPDYREYGRPPASTRLPAGTYWVSMAQAQKHWVQAMLNEDTYTPFPYFYDVTAWSLPLLGNVSGGYSGRVLRPVAVRAAPVAAVPAPKLPRRPPTVGVLQLSAASPSAVESTGWLRYKLDRVWRIPHRDLTPADVAAGRLAGVDVLLVPNGPADDAYPALGAAGQAALRSWVEAGGRYVGWQGGTVLAARLGVSTVSLADPTSDVPGTLFRVKVDPRSPLAAGVGRFAWNFYSYDPVMRASRPADVVVSYPAADSPDWFTSGFASGAAELGGTAAVVDERVGRGRTVAFATEPNFRAFTDGTAKLLLNAIVGRDPARTGSPAAAELSAARRSAEARAAALPGAPRPIRVSVPAAAADRTEAVLRGFGAQWSRRDTGGRAAFTVANRAEQGVDQHPWARDLPAALSRAGVRPIAVVLPR
jgi:hypothetical protein